MIKTDVLILGGGLAGLSTAFHLGKTGTEYLLLEKADDVGGVSGSFPMETEKGTFTFDYTGHLLHLHDPYGKKLIESLLRGNLAAHQRRSAIYSHRTLTRYPFQANTYGLPRGVVEDCVAGFVRSIHHPRPAARKPSFEDWCLRQFGEGIYRHFMLPYNKKVWRRALSELTTEWQGRFIPKPKASEVLFGAFTDQKKFFGYNANFNYPKRGAIQVLPDAFNRRLKSSQVRTRSEVVLVDLRRRRVKIRHDGSALGARYKRAKYSYEWIGYKHLVNTMPLIDFLDLAEEGLPAGIRRAGAKLRYNTVYSLNIGVDRLDVSDKHWIYYPEARFPFYRVGFYGNFSRRILPPGTSSMYVEVSRGSKENVDLPSLKKEVMAGLKACGLLKPKDRILAAMWNVIRCAYVIYDFDRTPALDAILRHLKKRKVESTGRYGAWKYSFMEETILDGRAAARRIAGLSEKSSPGPSEEELKPLR